MKSSATLLASLAAASLAAAQPPRIIDLGDGSKVEIDNGRVKVTGNSASGGSISTSSTSRITIDGNTITTVTSERNGQRTTRTIVTDKNGRVTIDGAEPPASPDQPDNAHPPDDSPDKGGWLGVHSVPLPDALRDQLDIPPDKGILIEFVAANGPAANAGLQPNDIILSLNNKPVSDVADFKARLKSLPEGSAISMDCLRKGKPLPIKATLGTRPPEPAPGSPPDVNPDDAQFHSPGSSSSSNSSNSSSSSSSSGSRRRTVVVEKDGTTRVLEDDQASDADAFDLLLSNPDVPESTKNQIRRAREEIQRLSKEPNTKR
jgi:hypothetical protein